MYRALARACLIASLWLSLTHVAFADDERARRATFERAQTHLRNEQWDKARLLLETLWRERSTYDVALQLGQAEYQLKRFRQAAEHLAYGLATLPPREKLETASRSRQILELCRQEIGTLELRVNNKGAEVLVDGKLVGISPLLTELYVDPGNHRFEVQLASHRSESWSMQFSAGQVETRVVNLSAIKPSKDAALAEPKVEHRVEQTVSQPPSPPSSRQSYAPVVVGGIVAVAGIATGIGLQLMRNSRESEQRDIQNRVGANACRSPDASAVDSCDRLRTLGAEYDSLGRVELVSLLLGGLALAGTGTYFLLARPDREYPATARTRPIRVDASVGAERTRFTIAIDF